MCGIVGIYSLNGKSLLNIEDRISKMNKSLKHRGPDQNGLFISEDKTCAIGNTRLSIVDVKSNLRQPLESKNGDFILSFNGEIYNYKELKKDIFDKNFQFRSDLDTEVLLEGFLKYGKKFLDKIDGVYSFVIYNKSNKSIELYRDLMGERHLFYRIYKDELIFASEIEPIIRDNKLGLTFCFNSIASAIRFGSCGMDNTLFKEIKTLKPGFSISAKNNGKLKIKSIKKLCPKKWLNFFKNNPNYDEVIDIFRKLLFKSCKLRVPKEVDFFSTLSGGLDSSLINISLSDNGKKKVDTIFGFSNNIEERDTAIYTARKLNTNHTIIDFFDSNFYELIKNNAKECFDGSLSQHAPYECIANAARKKGKKVVIMSDAPDELMGGYAIDYSNFKIRSFFGKNKLLRNFMFRLAKNRVGRKLLSKLIFDDREINCLLKMGKNTFFTFVPAHDSHDIKNIFPDSIVEQSEKSFGCIPKCYDDLKEKLSIGGNMALAYATGTLPNLSNLRVDKSFFRKSIEPRLPFQSIDLVEFMVAMPDKYRFNKGGLGKKLLRDIIRKSLGKKVADRPKSGLANSYTSESKIYNTLKIRDVIAKSNIFDVFPFKKGSKDAVLNYKKIHWSFYSFIKTYENFKNL